MSAIEVRHLYKTFEQKDGFVEALKDISLQIEHGDIYGIIGMSGAGKSTLVRCLNYLEKPTSGEVIVEGRELGGLTEKELRAQRSDIAMIFQHFNLLMQKNVVDNVCFPMRIQGKNKKEAREKALELLETVGLSDKANAYPAQLSGGQKQRVAIARALASNPKILLCDEATSALDPQTTAAILDLLKEINRTLGITIVIITHQMSVIREICTHVAIVEQGSLVEQGLVEDIFNHPKSKAAWELISRDRPESSWKGDMDWKAGRGGQTNQNRENGAGSQTNQDREVGAGSQTNQGRDVGSSSLTKRDWYGKAGQLERLAADKKIRIVFSENSAFEPVIANMVLEFGTPVNILRADTKNVGGYAKGEMILGLPADSNLQQKMKQYLSEKGLEIEEVTEDVEQ